jgi:hypothetical protein
MLNESPLDKAGAGLILKTWLNRPLLFIFCACLLVELGLVLLDLTVNWFRWNDSSAIRRMFNITREDGLASLFAILQTFIVALSVWAIYILIAREPDNKKRARGWLVLALFFSYMVVDDGAMVHERIGTAFKQANENIELSSYAWQFLLAPLFVAMGLYMAWFLWQERKIPIRRDWLLAALFCLGTAILLDFIEGVEDGYQALVQTFGWSAKTIAHFSKSFEEFLEMLGMSIFLVFFLNYLGKLTATTEIKISHGKVDFKALPNKNSV